MDNSNNRGNEGAVAAAATATADNDNENGNENENAPVQSSPGYLATRLTTVFDNALAHTLRACSYANFAACFPTPAARRPDVLQLVWQQIVGKIENKAKSEFEGIMSERDVVRGLNELEQLIHEARVRKDKQSRKTGGDDNDAEDEDEEPVPPTAPHTLPPDSLFGAHLAPELDSMSKDLQARIISLSAENDQLALGISRQKDEVEALVKHLESVVKDLESTNVTLEGAIDEHDLRQEVLEVRKDLAQVNSTQKGPS